MHIYIPTMGRLKEQKSLATLSTPLAKMTTLVISSKEKRQPYVDLYGDRVAHVLQTPAACIGIAETREYIFHHAKASGHARLAMLDDDLNFARRICPLGTHTKLERISGGELEDMFDCVWDQLTQHSLVSISTRQGNNRMPVEGSRNTRALRFLAYATDHVLDYCELGRIQFMEDFDIQLQLLRAGLSTFNINYYAQDQSQTQAAGGCSGYRNHETHERAALRLHELHPDFVTVVDKKNKTGGEFGTRKEVRIAWKKAYASSGS